MNETMTYQCYHVEDLVVHHHMYLVPNMASFLGSLEALSCSVACNLFSRLPI